MKEFKQIQQIHYLINRSELSKYYYALLKKCEEKTNLLFGNGFLIGIYPTDIEVLRLEQFIHKNNLFDTNKIFDKYKI